MTDKKNEKRSFGELLSFYRNKCVDRYTGKSLSQTKFGLEIQDETGLMIDRNKVGKWEKGTSFIHQDDRDLLQAFLKVFLKYGVIETLDEANRFLESGNYRTLDVDEISLINIAWMPADAPPEKSSNDAKDESDSDKGPSLTMSIEGDKYSPQGIDIVVHGSKMNSGSAPPVPSLVIGREDDLTSLKERLTSKIDQDEKAVQSLTVIRGWPGVGKTTIASMVAYDSDIKEAFPDGILWISLGEEPNLLSALASWGRALGTDELLRTKTVDEASAQLRALLRHRSMLLIVDDVWQAKDAVPFSVGGRNCATLITTRQKDIASILAPTPDQIYLLPILKDDKALELLKTLAPKVVEKYSDESLELVQELEGLPLALQVAGRLLNMEEGYGFGIEELIAELKTGAKLLEASAPADRFDLASETIPSVAVLLQKSIERLDEITQDCYAYLGVFAPKPATFDLEAMKAVWQVDDAKPFARTLVDRGLLEYVKDIGRYQMHAVLVMHAKTLLT